MKKLPKDAEIAALLPAYGEQGDVTRILLTNGVELVYGRTMRATVAALARRRCKDVKLLRRWASRYTHRTLNNPIAPSADLVLVPVKTRCPRVTGDGTMGHINVAAVAGILPELLERKSPQTGARPRRGPGNRRAVIPLPGGRSVTALWNEKTTIDHLAAARHIHAELVRDEEEAVLRRLTRRTP